MQSFTALDIRDFRVRGNYFTRRSLLSRSELHSLKKEDVAPDRPGYSPPVVYFQLERAAADNIVVSEVDIPVLCQHDFDKARQHLSLILNARSGDPQAVSELYTAARELRGKWERQEPAETSFVVPSTSSAPHSDQDISQKGFILLKLSQEGYPVPDFVVVTGQAYVDREQNFERHLCDAIRQLEVLTFQRFGDSQDPLVFAMRCATARYIPGVMDTYLNVGVTERTLSALEQGYGPAGARKMFLNNLRNLAVAIQGEDSAAALVRSDLPDDQLAHLIDQLSGIVRHAEPGLIDDPFQQAAFMARQAYKHFEENHDLLLTLCRGTEYYPSLILQKMVCTVRHDEAYAGVLSSRHTQTGVGTELQTAHNIFGEEMMTGTAEIDSTSFSDRLEIKESFPAVYHFVPHLADLEREFEAPVTIEFAVEGTKRYQWFALLQLNETGMAGRAAITAITDLHKAGAISRKRVTELIRPYHIKQLTSDTIDQETFNTLNTFCSGIAVLPRSAVSARVYFSGDAALRAKSLGEKVCLCKKTFVPTDTVVMREVDAIISLTSAAVHVVTICQSFGIPALLNVERHGVSLESCGRLVNSAGKELHEGDWITISSRRHAIYEGKAKYQPARLLRYMRGEKVEIDDEERKTFESIAYAYRYYQQMVKALKLELSSLNEVTRLVNFELRGESSEAKQLVNGWFDDHETLYMEEVLKSDIGDHLSQSNVFEMLTLERKVRFFRLALAKCARERICGYEAGAFMLGRFLSVRYPVAFWKSFTPSELGLLVNEWVLFEKYMQLLHNVGERKVLQARKKILKEGLDELYLHEGYVQALISLKLSGAPLKEVGTCLPEWTDPQCLRVLELLQQPYNKFYNFRAEWSLRELRKICEAESLPLPAPEDV